MNQLKFQGQQVLLESAVLSDETAHLLSLVGAREAVRAIWAGLIEKRSVTLELEEAPSHPIHVTLPIAMRSTKLECGRSHLMMVSPLVNLGQIIIARTPSELDDRTWAALQRKCQTPLHASWRGWALGELPSSSLTCYGVFGRDLAIPADFSERVSQAVRWSVLCA